jgi:hypothetical protein
MTTIVYVRDISNHRVHKRFREEGVRGLYSHEADNADSSGAYEVLTDAEMSEVAKDDLCRRCWPNMEDQEARDAVR